jgi:hypothetical protein
MAEVRATERGYYGSKLREPGEVFDVADGVTGSWFEPVHPLDHDADGRKGGSLPLDGEGFDAMTVPELKAYAESKGIDLGDATRKADIVAAIELASEDI